MEESIFLVRRKSHIEKYHHVIGACNTFADVNSILVQTHTEGNPSDHPIRTNAFFDLTTFQSGRQPLPDISQPVPRSEVSVRIELAPQLGQLIAFQLEMVVQILVLVDDVPGPNGPLEFYLMFDGI